MLLRPMSLMWVPVEDLQGNLVGDVTKSDTLTIIGMTTRAMPITNYFAWDWVTFFTQWDFHVYK